MENVVLCARCSGPIGLKYVASDEGENFHPECVGFMQALDPADYAERIRNAKRVLNGQA